MRKKNGRLYTCKETADISETDLSAGPCAHCRFADACLGQIMFSRSKLLLIPEPNNGRVWQNSLREVHSLPKSLLAWLVVSTLTVYPPLQPAWCLACIRQIKPLCLSHQTLQSPCSPTIRIKCILSLVNTSSWLWSASSPPLWPHHAKHISPQGYWHRTGSRVFMMLIQDSAETCLLRGAF